MYLSLEPVEWVCMHYRTARACDVICALTACGF